MGAWMQSHWIVNLDIMSVDKMERVQPQLIVMLTHNDFTVENAEEIFRQCRDTEAQYWGMKEAPLPVERMKALYAEMRQAGKNTALEVVGYTEEEGLKGARLAVECGCDILLGTLFNPDIAKICRDNDIRYFPFVGHIEGRPSVLSGDIDEIVEEARLAIACGADGVDLLGYRYVGDAPALNKAVSKATEGRVCIAGSIDSYDRLDEVKSTGASFFTIGGAFFENKFPGSLPQQINAVCKYLRD